MSVITHRTQNTATSPAAAGRAIRISIGLLSAAAGFLRKAAVRVAKGLVFAFNVIAEARAQRAMLEARALSQALLVFVQERRRSPGRAAERHKQTAAATLVAWQMSHPSIIKEPCHETC